VNWALALASTMSPSMAREKPAPAAMPLTAVTTGLDMRISRETMACR
jgi:hypothetical protein